MQVFDLQNSPSDPPNNTSVSYSGPVKEGTSVTLTCNTDSNPAADSYTWYKTEGAQVTAVGSKKTLSTTVSEVDSQFYCEASNRYGAQNSSITQINVHCKSGRNTHTRQVLARDMHWTHICVHFSSFSKGNHGDCRPWWSITGGHLCHFVLQKPRQPTCDQLHLV